MYFQRHDGPIQEVGALPAFSQTAGLGITGQGVRLIFDEFPACAGIVIIAVDGSLYGILSRHRFRDLLLSPFGADLYMKRPVGHLADREPLVLSADATLDEAANQALARGSEKMSEPMAVLFDQGIYGVLDSQVLLKALACDLAVKNQMTLRLLADAEKAAANLETVLQKLRFSNAELEQFAYVASHDLREPLRMVSNYLALIEKNLGADLSGEVQKYFGFAVGGAKRMDRMIRDLLDYSRIGRTTEGFEPVALSEVMAQSLLHLSVAIAEAGAQVSVAGALPEIIGVPSELTRLFVNLVGNAVKYRHPERKPEIEIGCRRAGTEQVVWVRDNGQGIAPEHRDRAFVIFQRLVPRNAYEGTGIGLAVCRKIVEHHQGRIWIEDAADGGCVFQIAFPADRPLSRPL